MANGPLWFGLPITSISNSQVVLNVNAASLQLVLNASPGKIMFGQVTPLPHSASVLLTRMSIACCVQCIAVDFGQISPMRHVLLDVHAV